MDARTAERIAKRSSGKFTLQDLYSYIREKAKIDANVIALKVGKWERVGKYHLLLKKVSGDMDDAFIYVVVHKHFPAPNWLNLLVASLKAKPIWAIWWQTLPGTDLLLDVWYVGDGSEGIPLIVESK